MKSGAGGVDSGGPAEGMEHGPTLQLGKQHLGRSVRKFGFELL